MSPGIVAACFSPGRLAARLPRPGAWRPYRAVRDRAAWAAVPAAARDHLLEQAAAELSRPWPVLRARDYLKFFEDGDRQSFEEPYFARRGRLGAAVLAAALLGPDDDRIGEVIDGVWLLCEETSWCVPVHHLFAGPAGRPLPDPARPIVDLFAAETAGLRGEDLNNWTPWIHANLLVASLLLDSRPRDILSVSERNHNDVGSFIVALNGRPLLIDVGVYTRQTFGAERYEIWTMQSSWHNVPAVDGFAQLPGLHCAHALPFARTYLKGIRYSRV